MKIKYDRKEARSIAATLKRKERADAAALEQKRRISAYIKKTVAEWPPLTAEQRDKLAALLRPAGGAR